MATRLRRLFPRSSDAVKNDTENGCFAAHTLGAVDAEGISTPVLIEALADTNPQMRRFASFGLGRIGRQASDRRAGVAQVLGGQRPGRPDRRRRAAYWSVSGKADEAVQVLQSIIQAPDDGLVRMWAADALAELGPAAKAAVPDLIPCLKSDTRYVVTSSAEALGRIGPGAASAVPALTARLTESDDQYTRVCIARALWRISACEKSLSVFEDALRNSRDFMAVSAAAEAVGEMGPQARGLAPLLRPLLKDSDSFVRDAAKKALGQIEHDDACQMLQVQVVNAEEHLGHNMTEAGTHSVWCDGCRTRIVSTAEPFVIYWVNNGIKDSGFCFLQGRTYKVWFSGIVEQAVMGYEGKCIDIAQVVRLEELK